MKHKVVVSEDNRTPLESLPLKTKRSLFALIQTLADAGENQDRWPGFAAVGGTELYKGSLSYNYVAVWKKEQNTISVGVVDVQ